ncbi:hypothetical protein NGRA_3624, partial [Nosema granulosis]
MQDNNSINQVTSPSVLNNMATAINGMREFRGNPDEDATVWIRDVLLIARLSRASEEDTLRAIVMKLRDTACYEMHFPPTHINIFLNKYPYLIIYNMVENIENNLLSM